MEWIEQLNRAINYMEEHLEEGIELEKVAEIACCSAFHFQRMFSYIANIPLSEYIRRRKMTGAAFDLQNKDIKVIDIALKYGYDSPKRIVTEWLPTSGYEYANAPDIEVYSEGNTQSKDYKCEAWLPIIMKA